MANLEAEDASARSAAEVVTPPRRSPGSTTSLPCGWRTDTRLDRPNDFDDSLAIVDERFHPITHAYLRRRLCRRSIHEDVAALAQPGRERASLHEADCAQPAIDTRRIGGEGIGHAF